MFRWRKNKHGNGFFVIKYLSKSPPSVTMSSLVILTCPPPPPPHPSPMMTSVMNSPYDRDDMMMTTMTTRWWCVYRKPLDRWSPPSILSHSWEILVSASHLCPTFSSFLISSYPRILISSYPILSSHNLIIHHIITFSLTDHPLLIQSSPAKHGHDNLHLLLSQLLQVQFLLHSTHKVLSADSRFLENQVLAVPDWQTCHLEGSRWEGSSGLSLGGWLQFGFVHRVFGCYILSRCVWSSVAMLNLGMLWIIGWHGCFAIFGPWRSWKRWDSGRLGC